MIKSILRNGDVYKNTNNVGVVYEYIGNNAFTETDIKELWDFIQQNNVFFELLILNVRWFKKYYITFFYGHAGYGNNLNNFDPAVFDENYNKIVNLKPKIEKLEIFNKKILETNLKLYTFGKEADNLEYLIENVQKNGMNYREEEFHNMLTEKYFSSFVDSSIWNQDYRNYVLQTFFRKDTNFSFFNVDQAIFEPVLSFVSGNEYFLFPFYYSGINQKVGAMEYQTLDVTKDIMFLDSHLGKFYDIYLKKISIAPKMSGIAIDKWSNAVAVNGTSSFFPLDKINDDQDMFFEINHSLYLYTKKPDVSEFLADFNKEFGTETILKAKKIAKEFNEMFLSHNVFEDICHIWHIQNIMSLMKLTKEYRKPNPNGAFIWREYFSNNAMEINLFDIVWVDPSSGTLWEKANGFIIGTSGSGKTFFSKKFVQNIKKEQVIVFDEIQNFEKMVNDSNRHQYNVIQYGDNFPNLIGRITSSNAAEKQGLLYKLVVGLNTELPGTLKESIRGIVNHYIEKNIGTMFKFSRFEEYCKTIDGSILSESDKRVFIAKLMGLSATLKRILNNDFDLMEAFSDKQKIIISYARLKSEGNDVQFFIVANLIEAVRNYIKEKHFLPHEQVKFKNTIIMIDEANLIMGKTLELDLIINDVVRTIRNYNGAIICIAQMLWDFYFSQLPSAQDAFYSQTSFHWILSPDEWEKYVEMYGQRNEKNKRIFENIAPQTSLLWDKFREWAKKEEDARLKGLDLTKIKRDRFCVFGYNSGNSYYIINTNNI